MAEEIEVPKVEAEDEESFGGLTIEEQGSLIDQVQEEYKVSGDFMGSKWSDWETRYRLYNNQLKKKDAIGDPLMFTIMQTILAALYNDELMIQFAPQEEGDVKTANQINELAEFDQEKMNLAMIRYKWMWNALFFGRALCIMTEFNRETKTPVPQLADMLSWYRDPDATSVNGDDNGVGAMRFGGRPISLTMLELENGPYEELDGVKVVAEDAQQKRSRQAKVNAQNQQSSNNVTEGDNVKYPILEWFTYFKGKKVVVALANSHKKLIRYTVFKQQDRWGIIDRAVYPDGMTWDGTSIPDLVEDKQRGRAQAQNLALHGMKAGQYLMYAYDKTKISNRGDLNFGFNKHIPVDGNPAGAIVPIERQQVKQEVFNMMDLMDSSAQRATATPDVRQGVVSGTRRTATELSIVSDRSDTRLELFAKVFTWAEKDFWRQWYTLYKLHFKNLIDKKVARVEGVAGYEFREFTRENIISNVDPDVKVKSRVVSEGKRLSKLQEFSNFLTQIQLLGADGIDKREVLKMWGETNNLNSVDMERIFPKTPDEIDALSENESLSKNEMVKISPTDNDIVHIRQHSKAAETKAKQAHVKAHMKKMAALEKNPNLQPKEEVLKEEAVQGSPPKLSFDQPQAIQGL